MRIEWEKNKFVLIIVYVFDDLLLIIYFKVIWKEWEKVKIMYCKFDYFW